jgi:uncharacterized protein
MATKKTHSADPILAEMVRRLIDAYGPDRIYLFGSRAREDASGDSDYDLMVVVQSSDLAFTARCQQAYLLLCGLQAAKDVIVLTREEFNRKRNVVASLPATVLREGKLLYAA